VWDVDSGRERLLRLSFPDEPLQNVHFDASGERLVTKQASKLIVWDASSGAELSRIEPQEDIVAPSAAFAGFNRDALEEFQVHGRTVLQFKQGELEKV
jgi:hypothetical protein